MPQPQENRETKDAKPAKAGKPEEQPDMVKLQFAQLFPPHVEDIQIRESRAQGFYHIGFYDSNGRLASLIEMSAGGAERLVGQLADTLSKK